RGLQGHLADVGLDLRLAGERPRPLAVGREGERVQLRGHVAGRSGIGVVAPGAADLAAALDDEEVFLAGLVEPDRRTQAGEAGADDQDPGVAGTGGPAVDALCRLGHDLSVKCY